MHSTDIEFYKKKKGGGVGATNLGTTDTKSISAQKKRMIFAAPIFTKLPITQHGHMEIFVRNFTSVDRDMRKLGGRTLFRHVSKV